MIRCRRQDFIDALRGDLLVVEHGKVLALGDRAVAAVEAAERGEVVELTVDGIVVSRIVNMREEKIA